MAEYNRLILVLADLSYGKVRPADEVKEKAAAILLQRGEVKRAMEHARKVTSRDSLINILTDRRFATLWPELERASGEKLEVPAKARLINALAKFKSEPDSLEVRLDLMQAYMDLGRLSDAEKLGAEVGRNLEELMTLGEATAYVVDRHADILAVLGRPEEADARRAALVATWTRDRRWVINMAINRLAALFTMRKYQQILDELDKPGNRYLQDSSTYAKQLLRVLRVSSLIQLGKRAEAQALIPDLRAHEDDAPAATIDALLISGMDAEAEKSARAYLNDPDKRDTIIQSLRVADRAVNSDDPLADEVHRRLRARPAVEAAFELYARDLPERFRRAN